MDIPAYIGVAISVGGVLVGIGVYVGSTKRLVKDMADLDSRVSHRIRNIEQWKSGLTAHLDLTYARKDTIDAKLESITDSLSEIKERQGKLIDRLIGPGV